MFTKNQLELLFEVAEVSRIPVMVKYGISLYLVDRYTIEDAAKRAGIDKESFQDWLYTLRNTYTMAVAYKYPPVLRKKSVGEDLYDQLSEHVSLCKHTSDTLKSYYVDGKFYHQNKNTQVAVEMLDELHSDIINFRNSVKGDINHQNYLNA